MDPNQRPPLPTATDVAQAGNPAINDIESLIAQADAAVGDASFTQGLAARRENLARLTGETQRVQQFGESPEFQANIQRMRELAPTAGPSSVLSSIIGTQEAQRGILSQAAQQETAGLDALNDFIKTAIGVVEQTRSTEQSQSQEFDEMQPIVDAISDGVIDLDSLTASERTSLLNYSSRTNQYEKIKKAVEKQKVESLEEDVFQVDPETVSNVAGIKALMQELKQDAAEITIFDAINPRRLLPDDKIENFNRRKGQLVQSFARLAEGGKLSDKDREFYQKEITALSPFGFQDDKNRAFDQIVSDLERLTGVVQPDQTQRVEAEKKLRNMGASESEIQEYLQLRGL